MFRRFFFFLVVMADFNEPSHSDVSWHELAMKIGEGGFS